MLAARGVPDRYGGRLCGCAWTKLALKHILATHNLHWRGNFGQRCGGVVLHARARDHARLRACAHVWFVLPHSLVWKSRRQGALATGRARLSWGCMSPNGEDDPPPSVTPAAAPDPPAARPEPPPPRAALFSAAPPSSAERKPAQVRRQPAQTVPCSVRGTSGATRTPPTGPIPGHNAPRGRGGI